MQRGADSDHSVDDDAEVGEVRTKANNWLTNTALSFVVSGSTHHLVQNDREVENH